MYGFTEMMMEEAEKQFSQEVPQLAWQLTKSFWLGGCVYNAEDLARGAA